jgi:tetratricopeptide (TPR) repeat protein
LHRAVGNVAWNQNKDTKLWIHHHRKALELEPTDAKAQMEFGNALRDKKEFDAAIEQFRKILQLNPKSPGAHINLGNCLKAKNDYDGAIHYHEALKLKPNYAGAHFNLGNTLKAKKDFDGAIEHYRRAFELDPNNAWRSLNNLGTALKAKADLDGATQTFHKCLELYPNHGLAHNNLGCILMEKNNPDGAIQHFRKALAAEPWRLSAHKGLRTALRMKKDFAGAYHTWNQLFMSFPSLADNPEAGYRFTAARDAVLASGKGDRNVGMITNAERKAMRQRAYEWVSADLDVRKKQLQGERPAEVLAVANLLSQLQNDSDLDDVRIERNLAELPEAERKSWQKLWKEVEQLRQQADRMFKPTILSGNVSAEERELVHAVKLKSGTLYGIDMQSKAFDTLVRLEDAKGKKLAENDDIVPEINTDSRLIFTPESDGVYRVVASAFRNSGVGPYTLTIREFIK